MKKEKKPISNAAAIIRFAVSIVIVVALIIGNVYAMKYKNLISVYFNQPTQKVVTSEGDDTDSEYFKTAFKTEEERTAYLESISEKIEEEGIVLLQNNNNVLPLENGAKISILGQDSVDPVYGGGGASTIDVSVCVDIKTSFEAAGFEINETLWKFYDTGAGSSYRKSVPDAYGQGELAVNEVPLDVYTDEVMDSLDEYSDAAVIFIGRTGSESGDLSLEKMDDGYTYLQISQNERDLIEMACENFDKVVVVLNTTNALELDVLEEYDIDACIWVGALGQEGATAVGKVIAGEVNPSGAVVDTYAYDSLSAPSIEDFGSYIINNSEIVFGNTYMVYAEGIYVGYAYYETRYEDVVLGNESSDNYEYTTQVKFPFGYGLSYTDFEWTDYSVKETDDTYEISVKVTNTGSVAGKDIVQIYMQSPYTEYDKENNIEKAAVELVGFTKTGIIEAGESETVTVSVNKEEIKVYDADGYGTYIVDAGTYYFAAGNNAHDALNNILAAKGYTTENGMDYDGNSSYAHDVTVDKLDAETYAVSKETEIEITNQFESADIKYYDSDFEYLSRSDWTGTWPSTYADGSLEASDELLADLEITYSEDPDIEKPITSTINDSYGELNVATLMGVGADEEIWNALVEQLSVNEIDLLVRVGGYATQLIESIGLPGTVDKDGTAGISSALVGGDSGTSYPSEVVIASTWNQELAVIFGECIGEDSLSLETTVWYAPACNIHRSPYSGRNFEYYSEDGFLSGIMAARTVEGAQSKGVIVTVKHFAVNDQETNRMGGAMFLNEQSMRELYLKPFEIAVREADALAMMASMNRIGARWTGGSYGLMTATLREEWGFNGFVVTDQASYDVFAYEDLREGLAAGTDLWLNTNADLWALSDSEMNDTVVSQMQTAAKHIIYAVSNSNAMNGITSNSEVVNVIPLWQRLLIAGDVAVAIGALAIITTTVLRIVKRKKVSA